MAATPAYDETHKVNLGDWSADIYYPANSPVWLVVVDVDEMLGEILDSVKIPKADRESSLTMGKGSTIKLGVRCKKSP